jgi:DNA-binding HxlR family transcriptional regulator
MGDSLLQQAKNSPHAFFVGIEVHKPGVGHVLQECGKENISNIRIFCHDAVEVLKNKIADHTLDKIQITEGALYPTLHALEADGFVTTETEFIGKRVRKYYSLSPTGKTKTKEKVSELADFMETMKFLLDIKTKTT